MSARLLLDVGDSVLLGSLSTSLNQGVDLDTVAARSNKKLWWHCDVADDHVWQATPYTRLKGHGCPFCSGRKTLSLIHISEPTRPY